MLKRAVVNRSIELALEHFARHGLRLPPLALWTAAEWDGKGPETAEIRDCMLGWDVTDFGCGQFEHLGRILFTLRNGKGSGCYPKSYAEKLSVNDNVFIGAAKVRFPGIEEDEPRRWYLCHEYPAPCRRLKAAGW